jgi:hypothetical protein
MTSVPGIVQRSPALIGAAAEKYSDVDLLMRVYLQPTFSGASILTLAAPVGAAAPNYTKYLGVCCYGI